MSKSNRSNVVNRNSKAGKEDSPRTSRVYKVARGFTRGAVIEKADALFKPIAS